MSNLLKSVTSKLAQSGLTTSNTTGNSSDEDPNEWQTVGIESPAESEAEQDEEELVGELTSKLHCRDYYNQGC